MPGTYTVSVAVPGVAKPLTSKVVVEGDPLPKFSAADRAARQHMLMQVYEWTHTLGAARVAARALIAQRDSITADFGAGGKTQADSINARVSRASADLDRVFTAMNGQRAPIEGWSGLPSVDQQHSLGYAVEDAAKDVAQLNKLIAADLPAEYKSIAKKEWPRKITTVMSPTVPSGPR